MSDAYQELLEATIEHLQGLKARGTRFVPVSDDGLGALNRLATGVPRRISSIRSESETSSSRPSGPSPFTRASEKEQGETKSRETLENVAGKMATAKPVNAPVESAVTGNPEKEAAFAQLRRRALACTKCANLVASRKNVVFGVGNIDAQLMFVGEAPGADEDIQAEPFVGKAGQLLTKIIEAMGLRRDQVYIANILKCRPDTPGQAFGNRKPTPEEMQTCIPFLHEQIDLIKPKVLVGLGGTAIEGLLGRTGINKVRGTWQVYRGTPLMPTFHPAYLLRTPGDKRKVWEDMLQVMEKLALPITDKQRNYFLKSA